MSMLKVRVVQAMIQTERPIGWNVERIKRLCWDWLNLYVEPVGCCRQSVNHIFENNTS